MAYAENLLILVVDDDRGVADSIARLLRTYGHSVHIAYDAAQGLVVASQIRPDLILHDIAMHSTDGYETARRLRNTLGLAETVLIAFSVAVDEARARQAGFDGWLIKPMTIGDLEPVIAMALERRKNTAGQRASADPREERS